MTETQRKALAALPVGGVHTLVDRVEWPVGWVHFGFDLEGLPVIVKDFGTHHVQRRLIHPPHGKPGDVIHIEASMAETDGYGKYYSFRVESVEVKCPDEWVEPESFAISGADVARIGPRRWMRITQELWEDRGEAAPEGHLWLTTIKREA